MRSKNKRFTLGVRVIEVGRLADSVLDMVMKKAANEAEAMLVLKLALAMSESYIRYLGIKLNIKEFDAFVSKAMKEFEKNHPNR